MNIFIDILALIGATWVLLHAALSLLLWRLRRLRKAREAAQAELFAALCDAVERHPAGSAMFTFRARPCGHLLHTRSLDEIDVEHLEFDHVIVCPVAEQILSKGKAA